MKHVFRDKKTGSVITGDINDIVRTVMKVRRSKGMSPTRSAVYSEVLAHVQASNKKANRRGSRVSFREAMAAGKAAVKIISGNTVSREESRRRWAICKGCPMKSGTRECFRCNSAKFLTNITGELKKLFGKPVELPGDSKKYSCGACDCMLAMLLPTKTSDLHQDQPDQLAKRPDFCWARKDSPNYTPS